MHVTSGITSSRIRTVERGIVKSCLWRYLSVARRYDYVWQRTKRGTEPPRATDKAVSTFRTPLCMWARRYRAVVKYWHVVIVCRRHPLLANSLGGAQVGRSDKLHKRSFSSVGKPAGRRNNWLLLRLQRQAVFTLPTDMNSFSRFVNKLINWIKWRSRVEIWFKYMNILQYISTWHKISLNQQETILWSFYVNIPTIASLADYITDTRVYVVVCWVKFQ